MVHSRDVKPEGILTRYKKLNPVTDPGRVYPDPNLEKTKQLRITTSRKILSEAKDKWFHTGFASSMKNFMSDEPA